MAAAESLSNVFFKLATPSVSNEARFRRMATEQFDFMWRCLRRLGVPAADVDDAVQQVFVVAADRIGDIVPGSERAFLYATASGIAANVRRAVRRRDQASRKLAEIDSEPAPDQERLYEQRRARELMYAILEQMPDDFREVFVLFELEDMRVPEIASMLQIPQGTVASRLRRAREDFEERVRRLQAAGARGLRHG
jgi:RNA polymerase sigma-70 factor, ECF subfamily